jgi:hypothetical protein
MMSQQTINLGTADRGNGDPLRVAFDKVNDNFTELYNGVIATGVVSTSASPPVSPSVGDLWWDTNDGNLYVYYSGVWASANAGLQGPQGVQGAVGPAGIRGLKGNTGDIGPRGYTGETGAQGEVGPRGLKGDQGDPGAEGPKGDKGDTGEQGLQGLRGLKGDMGEQGPQGLKGDTGEAGPQGDRGFPGTQVQFSLTAPNPITEGNVWWDMNDGNLYVHYNNQWVSAVSIASMQPDLGDWAFRNDLMYSLNGGVIENSDLTHGATAALTIPTNGSDSPIVLTNAYGNVALVSGASPGALKTWSFGTEGKLTLPAGTTYEYLNAPLTGHGDGLARLDFGLVTDGVSAQWIAASASPAGSGYSPGDTFTFNAAFLGIPGASVTITVITVGAGGSVEDLAFSMPPLYPADIYRDSPINLQVGPESNRWTFGATGNLTLPNGGVLRTDGNNVEVGGVTNFNVEASGVVNVYTNDGAHQWQFGDNGTLSLPTQSTPILTVNNVAPTPKIYRATSSNDASAINTAQASWYDAELTYIDIRDQDEIEKEYTYPWSGLPSWEAQELLADWNVNRPDGAPNPNPALSPALTNAVNAYLNWKELESNIDIVSGNKTFRFGNNGNLSLPGEITFTNTTNAKIVVGANLSPYEGTPTPVSTWTFGVGDGNGSITFPNGSVQTTAYTSTPFDKLVNGSKEVVLGSDGVLTMPQQGKLSVAGITAVNLASLETAYNDAEVLYSIERTTWMTVNNHTPRWYLLTGLVAYNEILDAAYTEPEWTGTATLTSRALAATTAYNTWQTAINNSELTVKSDTSAWTFNSENKLTLSQGGIISGGDPVAITAANNARASELQDWYYVITTGGADENIRPWHFAGPTRAERSAVVTAMWNAQQALGEGETLGWEPISAAYYNDVRAWIALNSSSDDYTEWKKLTTSVNITSDDKTWLFTNDGAITFPDGTTTSGKGITLPVNQSLTVTVSHDEPPPGHTNTFKVNPESIKLPTGNGTIFSGTETAANAWHLDSANKTLFFPDAGDGVFPQIKYSTTGNDGMQLFTAAKPIKITTASNTHWTFGTTGSVTLPAGGDVVDSTSVSQLAKRVEGSWTVTAGTNTYSFTVPADGTYTMWVKGNIPNGIITWNATLSISNTNVPAIGTQYAWNYTGGGSPILLTAIPDQIRGAAGTISTDATYVGSTSNRFDFGISNTSGSSQTIYYGYTKV